MQSARASLKNHEVLGLFPYFGPDVIGGVQSSARIAWKAVSDRAEGSTVISYAHGLRSPLLKTNNGMLVVSSKGEAIRKVITRTWPQQTLLVWHLGLLKLLPFLRLSRPRIVLMLLGIEAWKKHAGITGRQLDRVDLFLSISEHTWRTFANLNPRYEQKPHRTVLLGVDEPAKSDSSQKGPAAAALMLSRLSKREDYKGHREVIGAWPTVLQKNAAAKLWIAGDGDLRPELESYARSLRLEESIEFFGEVSEEQKQALIQQSRSLVLPSRNEGFGLVYLEAMRLGRPCLVSNLDAGREVVNPPEAGLAVDPGDRRALADAVCRLISDGDKWTAWSKGARRRYEAYFTAAHFQKRLIDALFTGGTT